MSPAVGELALRVPQMSSGASLSGKGLPWVPRAQLCGLWEHLVGWAAAKASCLVDGAFSVSGRTWRLCGGLSRFPRQSTSHPEGRSWLFPPLLSTSVRSLPLRAWGCPWLHPDFDYTLNLWGRPPASLPFCPPSTPGRGRCLWRVLLTARIPRARPAAAEISTWVGARGLEWGGTTIAPDAVDMWTWAGHQTGRPGCAQAS